MRLRFLALPIAILAAAPSWAATYHVAPTGDDGGPGSRDRPFRTIRKAAGVVAPGDTCFVAEGTYPERVTLRKSGAEGKPITFAAAGKARMQGFDLDGVAYVRVVGFEITEVPRGGYGLFLSGVHHVEVRHNNIHHLAGGIRFYPGKPSHHVLVKGNTIAHCGFGGEGHLGITVSGDQRRAHPPDGRELRALQHWLPLRAGGDGRGPPRPGRGDQLSRLPHAPGGHL